MTTGNQSTYFVHTLLRARDWQHRPQFDQVCDWWREGGRGVCALVGMGGAGKTAIADRFLNDLLDDTSPTRQRVSAPHGVFVYSFYDDDKPENFFRHLQIWLEGDSTPDKQKSPTQLMFDIQQHQGLIILDGLEKVQESGARGGFGRLTSPSLRDLLNHIACGAARKLSVLVTSRFPLTDLRDSQPRFFHTLPVDQIDVAAAIALLRSRGVRGTDVQLAPIVEHCGRHALTVDLAGGYIKEYGRGGPATPLNLGTAEELQAEAEQELDDAKRAVLKQGIRFARIAQRYREAMLDSDEAALALLERICLFRLGVDCETLAAIFTGPDAEKVSGKALASLNADQLKRRLDWLIRMRIVERSSRHARPDEVDHIDRDDYVYTIHPALRDDFLRDMSRDAAQASHEAVRTGLNVSLGDAAGKSPSDPATLDLLEEIVHHTLQSGHVREAWAVYEHRMGGYRNLLWRLGAYERGERICRAFAGGELPVAVSQLPELSAVPYLTLDKNEQAVFFNQWGVFLERLGRVAAAANCFELSTTIPCETANWTQASEYADDLCFVRFLLGRLGGAMGQGAIAAANEGLRLAARANDARRWRDSHATRAHARALRGEIAAALADFCVALDWQHKAEPHWPDRPLWSLRGIEHNQLLARLGRCEEATQLTDANQEICINELGNDHMYFGQCQLILSALHLESSEPSSSQSLCASGRDRASGRDLKEVICWSDLVQARIDLSLIRGHQSDQEGERKDSVAAAETAITHGLKLARDCGYGLYHIDLLLQRARLHLLRGDAGATLDDIEVALDTGIPANEETGQVELLAANHEECGYAWAIPAGLQLRAEALLLQAAKTLGRTTLTEPMALATGSESDSDVAEETDVSAFGSQEVPANVTQLIDQAKQYLHEALDRWHDLRDPEPTEDNNFVHPETGEVYNYRAAETHRVLTQLEGGVLTRHPLTPIPTSAMSEQKPNEDTMSKRFNVALSFPGEHRSFVLQVAEALADKLSRDRVFYDEWYEVDLLGAGGDLKLQAMYEDADLVVPFFSEFYDKPWCSMEWETIRGILLNRRKDDAVIPVHLDDTDIAGWSAVNFGIRLRGRTPVQIADIILQALEQRKSGATSATSAAASAATVSPAPKPTQAASPPSTGALALWQEKLDYLQQQEPITTDANQKFALKKQIEEAQQKIRELSG